MGDPDDAPLKPGPPATRDRRGRHELVASLIAVTIGLGMILAVPELRHAVSLALHGNFGGLRVYVRALGAGGLGLLIGLMLGHALIFYPTEIVTATAGYVYGFLPGLGLVMGGWLASALLSYALGRLLGRPLLSAVLGPRFARLERGMERGGALLLLSGRLIPVVPFSLIGYVAGATHVGVARFAWTTAIGFLPLTAAVTYLGSRAQTLSVNDPAVWIAVLILAASLAGARLVQVSRREVVRRGKPDGDQGRT